MADLKSITTRCVFDESFKMAELIPWLGKDAWIFSERSPSKQTANEDSAAVVQVDKGVVTLLVADGCGGMAAGERASRIAVESVVGAIRQSVGDSDSLRPAILDGIEAANRRVLAIGSGAATTLAIVQINGHRLRSYHIGDSTILLVGNRGKIKLLTRAHAPVAYGVEAGLIHEDDAIHHEDLHLVSNVVGMDDMHIEIGPEKDMSQRDTLLVASDGLFDNLRLDEIVDVIRKGPLAKAAQALIDLARRRMQVAQADQPSKPDDLTFILFRPRM